MAEGRDKLFKTLERILRVVTDINTMTANQETVIIHGAEDEMLSQLASNKQKLITELDQLEAQFQSVYEENKEVITSKADVERLQGLVSKVVQTKAEIAQGEDKNKRLWASKSAPKVRVAPVMQPSSYVANQYKKNSKR